MTAEQPLRLVKSVPRTRPKAKTLRVPSHLSKASQNFWKQTVAEYSLEPHHVRLLTSACEAYDRLQQARCILKHEGIMTTDRHGRRVAHPCVAIERDARLAHARLLRELDLDAEALPDPRPPRRQPCRADAATRSAATASSRATSTSTSPSAQDDPTRSTAKRSARTCGSGTRDRVAPEHQPRPRPGGVLGLRGPRRASPGALARRAHASW
jgi:P27 family predicted phage terminase small subunit